MSLAVTSSNFSQEVLEFSGYVLVDFWANWCGPCQMLTPVIEEIEKENKVKVVKVDIDKDSQLAQKYNVNSIPTVLIFKNGQLQKNIIGFHSKQEYLSSISSYYPMHAGNQQYGRKVPFHPVRFPVPKPWPKPGRLV